MWQLWGRLKDGTAPVLRLQLLRASPPRSCEGSRLRSTELLADYDWRCPACPGPRLAPIAVL